MPRHESEACVKTDVVDRAWHRLEPDGPASGTTQAFDTGAHDHFALPRALAVVAHGERPHPALGTGRMRNVERRDRTRVVAPEHCAHAGTFNGITPDGRVEWRHPDPNQSVATVPLRECVAEQRIEFADVRHRDALRTRERETDPALCPRGHQSAPNSRGVSPATTASANSRPAEPARTTIDAPVCSFRRTSST